MEPRMNADERRLDKNLCARLPRRLGVLAFILSVILSPSANNWSKIEYRMELEPAITPFAPTDDPRPRLYPPPPVQLVAIADVTLAAIAGLERQLDAFYAGLLRLERDDDETHDGQTLVYRAENVRLRLMIHEVPPPRLDLRPLCVAIPSLAELETRLLEEKREYVRRRGLFAGSDCVALSDPAGNLVEISEARELI
jgi:hypothetical protein